MPAVDVVGLIMADHREVERLFEQLKQLPGIRQRLSESRRAELAEAFVAARTEHLGDRPGQATRDDLRQQASNAGLSGISSSSKDEIKADLLAHAEQSGD